MRKLFWISMRQLKVHEFHCTLRHLKNSGKTWSDIYLRLGEIFKESILRWVRTVSNLGVIYLLVSTFAENGLAVIKVLSYDFAVPISYILAFASILLLISAQHLITIVSITEIRTRESLRLRIPRFSPLSFGLFNGQDEMALATPVMANNFFKDHLGIFDKVMLTYLLAFSLAMGPLIGFIIFLFSWQYEIAFINPRNFLEGLVAFFGLGVTSIAVLYFIIFITPVPLRKNSFGIRWGFLIHLNYPNHPNTAAWLSENDAE